MSKDFGGGPGGIDIAVGDSQGRERASQKDSDPGFSAGDVGKIDRIDTGRLAMVFPSGL